MHSFDKTPRTLYVPILNTSSKYESIAKGSLLGMFEPIDEEVSEIQVTSWTDLEGKMRKVHQQLSKKKLQTSQAEVLQQERGNSKITSRLSSK